MRSKIWLLGFLCAAISAVLPLCAAPTLLAHYPCDDVFPSGGWNYTSQVGGTWPNGQVGQSAGVPYMNVTNDPVRGSVLRMNASWCYLNLGSVNPLSPNNEFTAMLWVKHNESGAQPWEPLISKRGSAFSSTYWQFATMDGNDTLRIEDDNQSVEFPVGMAQYDTWSHYAFSGKILDPTSLPNRMTVELFFNGQSVKTGVLDLDPLDAGQAIVVGNNYTDKAFAQIGALFDDIMFFGQALTAAQVYDYLHGIGPWCELRAVGLSGQTLTLQFTGRADTTWALRASTDLQNWGPLNPPTQVVLTGGTATIQVDTGGAGNVFYRTELVP